MPTKGRKRKASTSPSSPRKRRSESESEVSASGELSIRTTEGQTAAAEVHDLDGDEDEQDPRPTTEDNDMTMEVILAPPAHVVTGSQFRSPFVVIFKTPGVNPNENAAENQRSSFCGWWAYLSLMNEDSSTSLAPPQTGLLLGQPVAAIRPLQTPIEDQDRAFAYASWSGVTITAPGRYCLKVNAIDMQSSKPDSNARVLPALHTAPFSVADNIDSSVLAIQDSNIEKSVAELRSKGFGI